MDASPIKAVAALISGIDETVWVDPASPPDIVPAPLTRDHVLPLASLEMHAQSA